MKKPVLLRTLINWKQVGPHPVRKLVLAAIGIFLTTCLLIILVPPAVNRHPVVAKYGLISFAVTIVLIWISGLVYGIVSTVYRLRKHIPLWNQSADRSPVNRYRQSLRQQRLNDPFLNKIGRLFNNFGLSCFFIWLVQFLIVSIILIKKGY